MPCRQMDWLANWDTLPAVADLKGRDGHKGLPHRPAILLQNGAQFEFFTSQFGYFVAALPDSVPDFFITIYLLSDFETGRLCFLDLRAKNCSG